MSASLIPELNQPPEDAEPSESISMDYKPIFASGYPDGWRAMDDRNYAWVVYQSLWYPQNWPETVLQRKREQEGQ
jgi:hypothetical protein